MDVRAADTATAALARAERVVFWTDRPDAPAADVALDGDRRADLAIVGGGFTGLWAALQARGADPSADILVLEADRVGAGASGRNGGFMAASLTHGLAHGARTWPDEMAALLELGHRNFDAIEGFTLEHGIECDLRRCGKMTVAVMPHHVGALAESARLHARYGESAELLDASEVRSDIASPGYHGGLRIRSGYGLVDPARLGWGLARVARERGVTISEHTRVVDLRDSAGAVSVVTDRGTVRSRRVIVATNAFPAPLRRLRHFIVPFYDHVVVTEPLSEDQWADLGWPERQGVTDAGNFFHYYRPTPDGRILFGGYDAVYHFGSRVDVALEQNETSQLTLARHFFETFPQLEGLSFSHRWGGAIDSTSRFTPVIGTAFDGRVAYAVGFTGLGVASSRFAAAVTLDLLAGRRTPRTDLAMVRRKPLPFPPEPLRWLAVRLTQRELARQDRDGRSSWWLRLLDRMGVGFTS